MTDMERLDLIEHYKWNILFSGDGTIIIVSTSAEFKVEDRVLRFAIEKALGAQREWSMGQCLTL